MTSCDLCGKSGPTVLSKIEGVPYRACSNCAGFGQQVKTVTKKKQRTQTVDNRVVMRDVAKRIRDARSKSGLTQKDLASRLGIKESVLHAWEGGSRKPTVPDAVRIGKILGISLVEQPQTEEYYRPPSSSSAGLTIADMMKKK